MVNMTVAVVSVIANFSFIPLFGFMGAVYARLAADVVGNPLSAWFVRREGMKVRVEEYIKPMVLMVLCYGVYAILGNDSLLWRGTTLLIFMVLSLGFSVVTRNDLSTLIETLTPAPRMAVEK
jgi:hypothetical protein